jgi:hypothetical protein
MKDIIKNILKEEQEYSELEQNFRNSMQKLQYIFESQVSSEIDSVEISEIEVEVDPSYTQVQGKLTVKSLFEDHDFGSIGRHADRVENEIYKINRQYTFTENGGLIRKGTDNDWFLGCMPIGMKWAAYGDEVFVLILEFWLNQDEYDA